MVILKVNANLKSINIKTCVSENSKAGRYLLREYEMEFCEIPSFLSVSRPMQINVIIDLKPVAAGTIGSGVDETDYDSGVQIK